MSEIRPERFYHVQETANILSCSRRTIYRVISDGDLMAFKMRGSLRIKGDEIIRYVQRQIAEYQSKNI